jgi:hypothetical protein
MSRSPEEYYNLRAGASSATRCGGLANLLQDDKTPKAGGLPPTPQVQHRSLLTILILPESVAWVKLPHGVSPRRRHARSSKGSRLVRVSLTTSGAITAVSMPVTLVLFPSTAIPVAILAALGTAIVAWHLRRGGRAIVRRTPKGSLSFTLDSTRRNRRRGEPR